MFKRFVLVLVGMLVCSSFAIGVVSQDRLILDGHEPAPVEYGLEVIDFAKAQDLVDFVNNTEYLEVTKIIVIVKRYTEINRLFYRILYDDGNDNPYPPDDYPIDVIN